jgi:putative hydrolase of the HAD superfamily
LTLPRALLIDLDDTIVNYSGSIADCWKHACSSCRSDLGPIAPDLVHETIERTRAWFWSDPDRHREGRLDLDAAAERVVTLALAELGTASPRLAAAIAARYRTEHEARLAPFPQALETVQWLRDSGCRLALVSNGGAATQRAKLEKFELSPLFDSILIEGQRGFGKPDPRIYTTALAELGVSAQEAWMVGDHLEWDVAQPQRLGLRGIWVDAHGTGVTDMNDVQPDMVVRALSELRVRCAGARVQAG